MQDEIKDRLTKQVVSLGLSMNSEEQEELTAERRISINRKLQTDQTLKRKEQFPRMIFSMLRRMKAEKKADRDSLQQLPAMSQ